MSKAVKINQARIAKLKQDLRTQVSGLVKAETEFQVYQKLYELFEDKLDEISSKIDHLEFLIYETETELL